MLAGVAGFLRALHVLLRCVRLYPSGHPRYQESLAAAERELRAAHEWVEPIDIRVEAGNLIGEGALQHRVLSELKQPATADSKQPARAAKSEELTALAEELSRRGIATLTFLRHTHLGELSTLAAVFHSAPADADWPELLASYRIQGILINAPRQEKKAETLLSGLVANVLGPELSKLVERGLREAVSGQPAGQSALPSKPTNPEECLGVLRLLAEIAASARGNENASAEGIAQSLGRTLAQADRRAASLLVGAMTRQPPQSGEALVPYGARLAQALVLDFCAEHHRNTKAFGAREVRNFLPRAGEELSAPRAGSSTGLDARWQEDAFLEYLYELFWAGLTTREKLEVLRGPQAWCAPTAALRHYLEEVARPEEARSVVLQYARALALPEAQARPSTDGQARLAVATGLGDLCAVIEQLWPKELPSELIRVVTQALIVERAPEVAGVLTALTDTLANMALRRGDFASYERILEAVENERGAEAQEHLAALRERLLGPERWQAVVESAVSNGAAEASLARLVGRQPERLLDDLGAQLHAAHSEKQIGSAGLPANSLAGLARLPQMARLVQAIGEPAVGALVTRLYDPRTQRATTAAKLLMAWPEGARRLLEVLPRALPSWDWKLQDMVVSELARQGASGCEQALLEALPHAHPLVVPLILDQIGLGGEAEAVPALLSIAAGQHERYKDVFVRIKAVEALGRIGTREMPLALRAEAAVLLRTVLRQRSGLTHVEPTGVRAAAEEALALIENHPASARVRTAYQAITKASVSFPQPRRYLRIPLDSPLRARIAQPEAARARTGMHASGLLGGRRGGPAAHVRTISLGGAFLETTERLSIGDSVQVQIQAGLRRIQGTAVVRNVTPAGGGVEFVHMRQEDREKLRRLVNRLIRTS
jgi:hypothetical protein